MNNSDIEFFQKNGYVVIENVFNQNEVNEIRNNLHNDLKKYFNINHDKIINGLEEPNFSVRKKSPSSLLFYPEWKIKLQLDERILNMSYDLHMNTYCSKVRNFMDPYIIARKIIPFIDRVCYRLPDNIRAEGGLELHLDRNPFDITEGEYYRPIQSFISLTDHFDSNCGGLQLIPKFHLEFDKFFYYKDRVKCGNFFRMHSHSYDILNKKIETPYIPAGSVVFWDNKIPHKTCSILNTFDTREVIYFSYLPYIEKNINYFENQYINIKKNLSPPAFNSIDVIKEWDNDKLDDEFILLNPDHYVNYPHLKKFS